MYEGNTKLINDNWDNEYHTKPIIKYEEETDYFNHHTYRGKWCCPYCGTRDISKETEVCFGNPGYIEKCKCNKCGAKF